jgi:outer membrane protein assembly factor BamB
MAKVEIGRIGIMITLLLVGALSSAIHIQSAKTSENGLVGWWKFDESSGTTAYDSSGSNNHGFLTDGPTWASGKIGEALSFDGTDDYVNVPDSDSLDLTEALTATMWFKPAITITPDNPWFYSLLMKWHGIGDQWRTGYGIQIKEEGKISFLRGHGSGEASGIGGIAHTWIANEWYHVAITYDASLPSGNGKIYVNGVFESQDDETRPIAINTLSLCINNDPFELWHPQVKFFPGVIDDVRIYNRALNEEEIRGLAQTLDLWPMFGHDSGHTSCSTSKAPNANNTLWTFEADTEWLTGPSIVNGKAFAGAANGKIYALNESSGALLWNYTTEGPTGIPAISNEVVFGPSNDGKLYALNESTGSLLWNFTTSGDVGAPVIANDIVFIAAWWEGKIYALNKTNGMLLWAFSAPAYGLEQPAVADGMVFTGSSSGVFYALDEFDGSVRWSYPVGFYMDDTPSVANGIVYNGAWNSLLYAFNETTGSLLWTAPAGSWGAAVAIAHNKVIYSFEGASEIRALDAMTGSFLWSYLVGDRLSRLALADGKVFAASKDRKVYALNESSGQLIWSYDTEIVINEAPCVPSVADDILFVGSATEYGIPAKLFAFGQHDIAVTDVMPRKTVVGQGNKADVNVTVSNHGGYQETFDVSLFAKPSGLVGYWEFDEGKAIIAHDSSGNGNHGTLINEPTWVDGFYGKALQFDGQDNYVSIDPESFENLPMGDSERTVTAWVNVKNGGTIIYYGDDNVAGPSTAFSILLYTDRIVMDNYFNGGIINVSLLPNHWYFMSCVYYGNTTVGFYVDGVYEGSMTMPEVLNTYSTGHFSIGTRFDTWNNIQAPFNGTIDEVEIYNRALSAREIWADYVLSPIEMQTVTLDSGESTNLIFTLNASSFAKGNYTMIAYTAPVSGETDMADNTLVDGWIIVTIQGDVNGDFKVDGKDVAIIAKYFSGSASDYPNADINSDNKIDGRDLAVVAKYFNT